MVRPTMGRPCCCRTAATAEESTPPDMATATRPDCVSSECGNVSNWVSVFMQVLFYLVASDRAERGKSRRAPRTPPCATALRYSSKLTGGGLLSVGGGNGAQLCDGGGDYVQGEIDFGGGGVAAEAEAEGSAGVFGGEADGGEDVGRLDGAGRAGGAGGNGKAFEVESDEQGFAFEAGEGDVGGVGGALGGYAVRSGLGNAGQQALFEVIAEGTDALRVFHERVSGDFGGFAEGDDAWHVFGAGAVAALVMAAVEELAELGAGLYVERPDTFGSVDFVAGERE